MRYNPSGKVLFCSICSLTKAGGGNNEYDVGEGIASGLTPRLAGKLHWHRERVRRLVGETSEVTWQGVALPELEYNRRLAGTPTPVLDSSWSEFCVCHVSSRMAGFPANVTYIAPPPPMS